MSFPLHLLPHAFKLISELVEDVQDDFAEARARKAERERQDAKEAREAREALAGIGIPVPQAAAGAAGPRWKPPEFRQAMARHGMPVPRSQTGTRQGPTFEEFRQAVARHEQRQGRFPADLRCPTCGETTITFMPAGPLCMHCGGVVTVRQCGRCNQRFAAAPGTLFPECPTCGTVG
jgi:hypothetical protein